MIFHMVVMLLMVISKLQARGSFHTSGIMAFMLAVFSQLTQHVIHNIEDSVLNLSVPSSKSPVQDINNSDNSPNNSVTQTYFSFETNSSPTESPSENVNSLEVLNEEEKKKCNGTANTVNGIRKEKTKKKKKNSCLHRLRRRRKRLNSLEDSDISDGEEAFSSASSTDEGNSDISEDDEIYLSSDDDDEEDEKDQISTSDSTPKETSSSKSLTIDSTEKISVDNRIEEDMKCNREEQMNDGDSSHHLNGEKFSNCLISSDERNGKTESKELTNNSSLNNSDGKSSGFNSEETNIRPLDPADLIEIIAEEGILESLHICADWLRGETKTIKSCGKSINMLISRIISLLNLINIDANALKRVRDSSRFFKLRDISSIYKMVPLPEDVVLKGMLLLQDVHSHLDWDFLRKNSFHTKEEAVLRVFKLVDFGHYLLTIKETGVQFDDKINLFFVEQVSVSPVNDSNMYEDYGDKNHTTEICVGKHKSKPKGELMQNMGQLWLKAEVRDLESKVKRRGANLSPYLAVDCEAIIHYMHLVKQLVGARKFIILIPTCVVSALDELKKEVSKAREAIRWLESQFQRGNRFLRAQRAHERLAIPLIKLPKKKAPEAWLFFQVIECCNYFSQQSGTHRTNGDIPLVTLLTGQKFVNPSAPGVKEDRGFSPLGIAKSAGINLEHIESFHSKWKNSSKSHG